MSLIQTLLEAFRSLMSNRLRTFLTMLGIIIGIASVVMMLAVGDALRTFMDDQLAVLGSNQLIVQPGVPTENGVRRRTNEAPTLSIDDAEAMNHLPSVRAAAAQLQGFYQVVSSGANTDTRIIGSTPEIMVVRNWRIGEGVGIDSDDVRGARRVAVIGRDTAKTLFQGRSALGESIRIAGTPFTVIGVLEGSGRTLDGADLGDMVLLPITAAPMRQSRPGTVHYVSVQARSEKVLKDAEQEIQDLLRDRHRITGDKADDFEVENLADFAKQADAIAGGLSAALGAVGTIALLVGGIGIMNIMLVSVSERVREIGLRMAIGAQPRHILVQFLAEAVLLCLLGGLIGIGLAALGAAAISAAAPFTISLVPSHIITAVGFSSAVGVFFGYYPARRASRMLPIECLRQD